MAAAGERDEGQGREQLPELVVSLIESVARYMKADRGRFRIEFELDGGELQRWFKHEGPAGRSALEQFGES